MQDPCVSAATLGWKDNIPYSQDFDDIYYSKDNGQLESQYVFLEQNHLAQRFAQNTKNHFIIGETGFGTGLNFLNTWRLWQQAKKTSQQLFFISCELHPLAKKDLSECLKKWPELADLSEQLIENYPPIIAGMHSIKLADNVVLILLFDEVYQAFSSLLENTHPNLSYANGRCIDAWFLDGFSPEKNTAMWRDEVFQLLGRLSAKDSSLSTFTAAGFVKRGLEKAGFEVNRVKGFLTKKHMISARFKGLPYALEQLNTSHRQSHFGDFWPVYRNTHAIQSTLIIGAGIAGCLSALALAENGIKVSLIDAHSKPMQGASGNGQAVLFPKLSLDSDALAEFNLFSLLYAWRFYSSGILKEAFSPCGVIDLICENRAIYQKLAAKYPEFVQFLSADEATEKAGSLLKHEALYYPLSGFIETEKIAQMIQQHDNIQFIGDCAISQIEKISQHWQARSDNAVFSADSIVLCNAQQSADLLIEDAIKTRNVRGQISRFTNQNLDQLSSIVCFSGYICPAQHQQYTCGASFDIHKHHHTHDSDSQTSNLQRLKQFLPRFDNIHLPNLDNERVAFRCYSADYLPLIGPIAKQSAFTQDFAAYRYNAKARIPVMGQYHQGLFIHSALGSRGFSSAPIGAALLCAYMLDQPPPLPFNLVKALHPARFIIREIARVK